MNDIDEIDVINKMQDMCEESCPPDLFEAWESLKAHLMNVRKNLRNPPKACPHCDGKGFFNEKSGYNPRCLACNGTGRQE